MQKIKADKKLLAAANMDPEAKEFWPLYEAYQKESEEINQQIGRTTKEHAAALNKGPIPDDTATKLMNEALSVQEAESNIRVGMPSRRLDSGRPDVRS